MAPRCQGNCHGRGHLEAVASGDAADRAAQELWGGDADAHRLVEDAKAGEHRGAWRRSRGSGTTSASAIGSLVNIFDPEVVVVGGGFGAAAATSCSSRRGPRHGARRSSPPTTTLRIVEAELGDDAGLIGAGLVAFEALDGER